MSTMPTLASVRAGEPLISIQDVQCTYRIRHGLFKSKQYTALRNVSFDIKKGETLGVIGRNGAGKSSLMKLIAGIILPDKGRIIRHEKELHVALLTLAAGFSPLLTGRQNAILGAMMLGHTRKQAETRLEKIIEFSGLGDWIDEPLRTYSTGMKARLGFSVAMELSPDVLLVDEVLGVGDEMFRKKSTTAMKGKMKSGLTVVYVSHAIPTVRELCDRVVWIDQGCVKMQGAVDEVIKAYQKEM